MTIEVVLSTDAFPLSIEPGATEGMRLRWAGPLSEGAPTVAVTATGAWVDAVLRQDLQAIDRPPGPVPPGLWRAIAARVVDAPGVAAVLTSGQLQTADWRRALQRAAFSRGAVARPRPPREPVLLETFSSALVEVLPLGAEDWAALTREELVCSRGYRLTRPNGMRLRLLRPLRGEDSPTIAMLSGSSLTLTRLSPEGPVGPSLQGEVPGEPLAAAWGREGGWVLTTSHIAWFPEDPTAERPPAWACAASGPGMGFLVAGQWLVVASESRFTRPDGWKTDHLLWVDLSRAEVFQQPWTFATAAVWHADRLFTVHSDGIRATTAAGSVLVNAQPDASQVAWVAGQLAVAGRQGVVGDEVRLHEVAYDVVAVPGGVVWRTIGGVRIQHPRADVAWTGVDDLSVARWRGHVAVVFGDNLALWTPDGGVVIRTLPHTGQLWGAWEGGVVVGPPSGGNPARPCAALVAVSWDGAAVDRLAWSRRWATASSPHADARMQSARSMMVGGRVLLGGHQELAEWRPAPVPTVLSPAEPPRGVVGLRRAAVATTNPRDDWPVPGLHVEDEEVVVIDGDCAGSTGVAPAPGLSVGRDGTVIAVRSRFAGGVALSAGSRVWAVHCADLGTIQCVEGAACVVLHPACLSG